MKKKSGGHPRSKKALVDIVRGRLYKESHMTTETAPSTRGHVDAASVNALSIGQVSEQYRVSIDTLRYWDRIGILSVQRVGSIRVYMRSDLERLETILQATQAGYRVSELKLALGLDSLLAKPAISGTRLLRDMMGTAEKGTTVKEPMPSKRAYNSAYRRLERAAKATGRKVVIRTSDDQKSLEARIVE